MAKYAHTHTHHDKVITISAPSDYVVSALHLHVTWEQWANYRFLFPKRRVHNIVILVVCMSRWSRVTWWHDTLLCRISTCVSSGPMTSTVVEMSSLVESLLSLLSYVTSFTST